MKAYIGRVLFIVGFLMMAMNIWFIYVWTLQKTTLIITILGVFLIFIGLYFAEKEKS